MQFYRLVTPAYIENIQLALIQSFDMLVAVPYYRQFFFSDIRQISISKDITYLLEEISLKWDVNLECNSWQALLGKLILHNQSEIKDLAGGDFSYFSGIYCQNYGCCWK